MGVFVEAVLDNRLPLAAILGVGILAGIIGKQDPIVERGAEVSEFVSEDVPLGIKESSNTHHNLIGVTFQAKGAAMFAPSLDLQAKQGGATLLGITEIPFEKQPIPVERVDFLRRRRPGPNTQIFPAYDVIPADERQIRAIAVALTTNDATGEQERYFLLSDPCKVDEMPSNEHNRQLLPHFPAAFDTRTQIVFPLYCWVLEKRAPYDWIN